MRDDSTYVENKAFDIRGVYRSVYGNTALNFTGIAYSQLVDRSFITVAPRIPPVTTEHSPVVHVDRKQ